MKYTLSQLLEAYTDKNVDGEYEPVAVGKYGIRKRSDIYKKELAADYTKNKVIYKDTMTIGLGTKQIDFGILKEDAIYSVSPAYVTFRINTSIVYSAYLELLLHTNNLYFTKKYMVASARQGKKVNISGLLNEKVEIPGFPTQEEVIKRVSAIEFSKANDERLLVALDELEKSLFYEMFGDPVDNEKGWEIKPLLNMGKCKNGMNFHYDEKGVEINCLGVGDFKDLSVISNTSELSKVSLNEMPSEELLLQDGDIVFVRSNGNKALVGRSLIVYPGDTPTVFSGFCIRYRKNDNSVDVNYLLRVLKSDSIRSLMAGRGANIQNLNQKILGKLLIPIPPIELQKQFVDFENSAEQTKAMLRKRISLLDELYKKTVDEHFLS